MVITHTRVSEFSDQHKSYVLNDLLLVPFASKNLMSIYQFCFDNDVFLEFNCQNVKVQDVATKKVLMTGAQRNGLYELPVVINRNSEVMLGYRVSSKLWHCRLGHLHQRVVDSLVNKNLLVSSCKNSPKCDSCFMGKMSSSPHPSRSVAYKDNLSLVFADIIFSRFSLLREFYRCKVKL